MIFSNTNCLSSDLHSSLIWSWFECNVPIPTAWALIKSLNECHFRIPTAWALICTAADLNAICEYQLHELWLKLWMNAIFEYQLHELWFAQQLIRMQFENTNCRSSDYGFEWMQFWFWVPTVWALICTAADLKAIFEYQLQELWLKLWMNALFEACRATYSEADMNAILFIPTAWALIKLWMNAICFLNTNCMSSDLYSSLLWSRFECNCLNTNWMSSD